MAIIDILCFENPIVPHFLEGCHGDCALNFTGVILDLKKLDSSGLKDQFFVKKANFRGPIATIGYLMHILASSTYI